MPTSATTWGALAHIDLFQGFGSTIQCLRTLKKGVQMLIEFFKLFKILDEWDCAKLLATSVREDGICLDQVNWEINEALDLWKCWIQHSLVLE